MLFLKTKDGQTLEFKSGYDMFIWACMNRPQWVLTENLTDRRELNDIIQNAKRAKAG